MAAKTDDLTRIVERFAAIGFSSTPSFSPSGDRLAFISDLSGTPQVWTTDVAGDGPPIRVTSFDDQVTNARWSPVDDLIAVEIAPGGGLNQQIYTVRSDGSEARRITPGGTENNRLGPWGPDGRHIFLSSSRDDPARFDVFRVELATGAWDLIARTAGIGTPSDVSRNGRWVLVNRTVNRGDSDVYQVDITSGTEIHLTPHEGQTQYWGAQFDRHGVVWVGGNWGERHALSRMTVHEGRTATHQMIRYRDDAELEDLKINDAGTMALLIWNVGGVSELELFDMESEVRAQQGLARGSLGTAPLPTEVAGGPSWSPDGRRIALVATGSASPVDIWTFEITGDSLNPRLAREARRVTHSPHEGVDLERLVRPRLERFTAHDGLELTGWLYVPDAFAAPGRCVISFHGGPEAQERPFFNRTYQALLANGISVFAPNVRGSAGFGKKFVHLDDLEKRFDGIRDIESCVRHVVDTGIADPKRVGITGGSYGGFMTMAGITEYPDLFAGAVCVCGIVNFLTFFKHTQPWMAAVSKTEYGDPDTQAELLQALSPINKIDRARTPTLVLHGANDTNVPLVEAEQMIQTLRQRGVEVASVIFPDEGHGFTKTVNRTRAAVETVRWFSTHL